MVDQQTFLDAYVYDDMQRLDQGGFDGEGGMERLQSIAIIKGLNKNETQKLNQKELLEKVKDKRNEIAREEIKQLFDFYSILVNSSRIVDLLPGGRGWALHKSNANSADISIVFLGERWTGKTWLLSKICEESENVAKALPRNPGLCWKYAKVMGLPCVLMDTGTDMAPAVIPDLLPTGWTTYKQGVAKETLFRDISLRMNDVVIFMIDVMTRAAQVQLKDLVHELVQMNKTRTKIYVIHNVKVFFSPAEVENYQKKTSAENGVHDYFPTDRYKMIEKPFIHFKNMAGEGLPEEVHLFLGSDNQADMRGYNETVIQWLRDKLANPAVKYEKKTPSDIYEQLEGALSETIGRYIASTETNDNDCKVELSLQQGKYMLVKPSRDVSFYDRLTASVVSIMNPEMLKGLVKQWDGKAYELTMTDEEVKLVINVPGYTEEEATPVFFNEDDPPDPDAKDKVLISCKLPEEINGVEQKVEVGFDVHVNTTLPRSTRLKEGAFNKVLAGFRSTALDPRDSERYDINVRVPPERQQGDKKVRVQLDMENFVSKFEENGRVILRVPITTEE